MKNSSKKHPSKKHRSKKHRSKKHPSKKHRSKKRDGMYGLEPIRPPLGFDFVQKSKDYTPMDLVLINKITNERIIADIRQPPLFMNLTIEEFINKWKEINGYDVVNIYYKDTPVKYTQQQIGLNKIQNAIIKDETNDTLGTLYYDLSKVKPLPMPIPIDLL